MSTATFKTVLGFRVIGLGTDVNQTDGTIWYRGPQGISTGNYDWKRVLVEAPSENESSVELPKGTLNLSALTPLLTMTQDVTQTFMSRQTQPDHFLHQDLNVGDTTMDLGSGGIFASLPTDVYIDNETIRVDSDDGGGTYSITRGLWGSTEALHAGASSPAGPEPATPDARAGVFDRPPSYRFRLVVFQSFAPDGNLYDRWWGYLDDRVTQKSGTRLRLKCEEAHRLFDDMETNQDAPELTPRDFSEGRALSGFHVGDSGSFRTIEEYTPRIAKQKDASGDSSNIWYNNKSDSSNATSYGDEQSFRNSFGMMYCSWKMKENKETGDNAPSNMKPAIASATQTMNHAHFPKIDGNSDENWGGREIGAEYAGNPYIFDSDWAPPYEKMKVHEVGVWEREEEVCPYPIIDAEQVVPEPFHVAFIAGILLFSNNEPQIDPGELNFLNGNVGMDASFIFGSQGKQSFIDAVKEDASITGGGADHLVDQLVLGYNGEAIEPMNIVLNLLTTHGYFLGKSNTGYLELGRFDRLKASDMDAALNNDLEPVFDAGGNPEWEWDPDGTLNTYVVKGQVGETPLHDGYSITNIQLEAGNQLKRFQNPKEFEYSLSHKKDSKEGRSQARSLLQRQAEIIHAQMPTVRMKAKGDPLSDPNLNFSIGAYGNITIPSDVTPPITYDEKGEGLHPRDATRQAKFVGIVFGRTWDPETNSYVLDIMLTNYGIGIGRKRAPAAVVSSYDSITDIITTQSASADPFDTGQAGAQDFTEGQQIKLLDNTLSPIDNTSAPEINNISGQHITLSGGFTTDPSTGDIITLADYDEFTFTSSEGFREWAFLADASDKLGSSDDNPDRWQ